MARTTKTKQTPKSKARTAASRKAAPTSAQPKKRTASKRVTSTAVQLQSMDAVSPISQPSSQMEEIRVAAYYIAEKNGFQTGRELDYWLEAEAQIRRLNLTSAQLH